MADSTSYSAENIQVLSAEEHIRKRPGMYVGSLDFRGITKLIESICGAAYELLDSKEIEIILYPDRYQINLDAVFPERYLEVYKWQNHISDYLFYTSVLPILSNPFELQILEDKKTEEKKTEISFWPDPAIWHEVDMDWKYLENRCFHFALLRSDMKLRLVDKRFTEYQQLFFHFPKGLTGEALRWRKLCYNLSDWTCRIEEKVGKNRYEISFFLGNSMILHDQMLYFASQNRLKEQGSLIQGIKSGIFAGLKAFAQEQNLPKMKIHRKKFLDELFILAHVDTPQPYYGGCTRSKLDMPEILSLIHISEPTRPY